MPLLSRFFDLIAPQTCCICGRRTDRRAELVCAPCNLVLPRLTLHLDPYDNEMARLYWGQVPIEKAAAWLSYSPDTPVSHMTAEFKFRSNGRLAYHLGHSMAEELEAFLADIDVIIPVPLARSRQRERGYNQSQLLAWGVSQATGITVADRVLERTSFAHSQTSLARADRMANVEGTIRARDTRKIENLHCLIIDDIITTGATTIECIKALASAAPTARFSVLALARTRLR